VTLPGEDRIRSGAGSFAARPDSPPAHAAERVVLCMKWGAKYDAGYVNRLYAMAARNLSGPFRFVCLTDDAVGVRAEVECRLIPAVPLPNPRMERRRKVERVWEKIGLFQPALLSELGKTILFLDLDVVVLGSLDALFGHPGDFLIIRDWHNPFAAIGNSSVFRFQADRHEGIYEYFCLSGDAVARKFHNEQEFLTCYMRDRGLLNFWPRAWCRSFRYHSVAPWPRYLWQTPHMPPDCRVLVFQGNPKPPDAILGRGHRWKKLRPAPWIANHWTE
jgi:hypothetical protein